MFKYTIQLEGSGLLKGVITLGGMHDAWQQVIEPPVKMTPKALLADVFFTMVDFTVKQVENRVVTIIGVERANPQNIVLNVRGKVGDVIKMDTL